MLTGITLENFKAFKARQYIPIKPITLVFGPNSAGKSSIVHALAFLRHVHLTNGHCDPGEVEYGQAKFVLGSWQELVHGHVAEATMKIGLHWGKSKSTITWAFMKDAPTQGGFTRPRVVSFEITDAGRLMAKGKNIKYEGIKWEIDVHRSHPVIEKFRSELWTRIGQKDGQKFVSKPFLNSFNDVFDAWLNREWHRVPSTNETLSPFDSLIPKNLLNFDGNLLNFGANLPDGSIPF
jgi:hypothetical protein